MRLVLDTNTVLSGSLWGGTPRRLIQAATTGEIELVSSVALLTEFRGVLSRDKFARQLASHSLTVARVFADYLELVTIVTPAEINPTIQRDPADDMVLAAALGGRAALIVSGDGHLLDLKSFQGIDIVTAAAVLDRMARAN